MLHLLKNKTDELITPSETETINQKPIEPKTVCVHRDRAALIAKIITIFGISTTLTSTIAILENSYEQLVLFHNNAQ